MERRFPRKNVDRWESTLAVCRPNISSIYPIQSIYIVDAWWYELGYIHKGTHMFHLIVGIREYNSIFNLLRGISNGYIYERQSCHNSKA